jgi:hypothetical protein
LDQRFSLSKTALGIWVKILLDGFYQVQDTQIDDRQDIQELLENGYIRILSREAHFVILTPVVIGCVFNVDEKRLLLLFLNRNTPVGLNEIPSWGTKMEIAHPLRATKRLLDLQILEFDESKTCLLARFRTY